MKIIAKNPVWIVVATVLVTALLFVSRTEAQPLIYNDVLVPGDGASSVGIGGGYFFRTGRVQPGILGDIYHSSRLDRFTPDMELLAALGWTINSRWYLMGAFGAGAAISEGSPSWSARTLLALTIGQEVAFRLSLFAQWTAQTSDVFFQARVGPSIPLGRTNHRISPNLGLALNIPGNGERVTAKLVPGCFLIFNL